MPATRILQLTDLHVFAEPDTRLKGIPTRELLKDVVDHILRHEPPFDHVIVTGDHTHDELPASYQAVREILLPLTGRLWQIPGNHDDRGVLRSVFADRISGSGEQRINFVFESGDWICIGLDTHLPGAVPGAITEPQVEWLRNAIAASDRACVALFMHHPPVDVGSIWMDRIGLTDRSLLEDLLHTEERIRLVCCGHVHHQYETQSANAAVVTTPSTGIQFSPAGESPTFDAAPPGYRVIELQDAGFSTHVVRLPDVRFTPDSFA